MDLLIWLVLLSSAFISLAEREHFHPPFFFFLLTSFIFTIRWFLNRFYFISAGQHSFPLFKAKKILLLVDENENKRPSRQQQQRQLASPPLGLTTCLHPE